MTLQFGKYAGTDIQDVPRDYIEWLVGKAKGDLKTYEGELARRDLVEQGELSLVEQIAREGYKALSKKLHPDTGGTTAEFQALQAANEQMKMILREVASVTGTKKD